MRRLLVLWDVDHTLADAGGVGLELYRIAFREMFGADMPQPGSMAGRTDRAIATEVLALAGTPQPRRQVDAFLALMASRAADLAPLVTQRGRALRGAVPVTAALAGLGGPGEGDGAAGPAVVQSLLTGNMRPLAEVKLGPLGLTSHLDLDAGAYGDSCDVRADLVPMARHRASRSYGYDFAGLATVLVGDTPLDIGAALGNGARAVGVATGEFTTAELASCGAHAVLPDLADTGAALQAIVGPRLS